MRRKSEKNDMQMPSGSGSIHALPLQERPYEKCRAKGPGALSDAELLAVLLRTGTRGMGAVQMAQTLLRQLPGGSLSGLPHLSLSQLCTIPGIGHVKAVQLSCVGELAIRMSRTSFTKVPVFECPETVAAYFMEEMRHKEQEELRCVFLDTKSHMIHEKVLFIGTVNASMASPREVFLEALRYRAVNLILLHNHPSGDPTPSREDVLLTQRIRDAGMLLGIQLIDHIIIGDQCFISMKKRGLI